jgi:dTMP kinase
MNSLGKFIVIEGVDGAGKHTQSEMLQDALRSKGIVCLPFSFPRYESTFGKLIAKFLNGDFGPLTAVDAHLSALLYAGDRFEAKPDLKAALSTGNIVLSDRYVASNMAHQTARMAPELRTTFIAWLKHLEYEIYGLPKEDLVLYLRLPASEARERVGRKAAREYTALQHDLQEADVHHLEQTSAVYDLLAKQPNWVTVECLDALRGVPRTAQEIHEDVLSAVQGLISSPLSRNRVKVE